MTLTILTGMFVMTLVVMIQRFYKNLLSDEGYLMFTLPAETWKHIVSKLIVSMMWTVASGIAGGLSILIITFDKVLTKDFIYDVAGVAGSFFTTLGASAVLFSFEFALIGIIVLASNVLIIYASIATGHLFNRHRILAALGAFILISTLSQVLIIVAGIIPGSEFLPGHFSSASDFKDLEPFIHGIAWYCIIFFGLLSAGCFALTNYILSRRLNLE